MSPTIPKHPCTNKCGEFQCNHCLIPTNSMELKSTESDFLVGDVVVYIDAFMPNDLMTVHKVQTRNDHYWLNGQCIYKSWIRTATVAELHANRRLEAEHAVAEVS